jgi:hypothetical protein
LTDLATQTIRPKMIPFKDFAEAAEATDELLATMAQDSKDRRMDVHQGDSANLQNIAGLHEDEDEEEDFDAESEGEHRGEQQKEEDDDVEMGEVSLGSCRILKLFSKPLKYQDGIHARIDDDDDDDDANVILIKDAKQEELDREEQEAFNREFAKMLADTTDVRKVDRKTAPPVFDTAVPLIRRQQPASENDDAKAVVGNTSHMQFSLLSKKGNKQQVSEPARMRSRAVRF